MASKAEKLKEKILAINLRFLSEKDSIPESKKQEIIQRDKEELTRILGTTQKAEKLSICLLQKKGGGYKAAISVKTNQGLIRYEYSDGKTTGSDIKSSVVARLLNKIDLIKRDILLSYYNEIMKKDGESCKIWSGFSFEPKGVCFGMGGGSGMDIIVQGLENIGYTYENYIKLDECETYFFKKNRGK